MKNKKIYLLVVLSLLASGCFGGDIEEETEEIVESNLDQVIDEVEDEIDIDDDSYADPDNEGDIILAADHKGEEEFQVHVRISYLRLRSEPEIGEENQLGIVEYGYHNVYDSFQGENYIWLKLGEDMWVAHDNEWSTIYDESYRFDEEEYYSFLGMNINDVTALEIKLAKPNGTGYEDTLKVTNKDGIVDLLSYLKEAESTGVTAVYGEDFSSLSTKVSLLREDIDSGVLNDPSSVIYIIDDTTFALNKAFGEDGEEYVKYTITNVEDFINASSELLD